MRSILHSLLAFAALTIPSCTDNKTSEDIASQKNDSLVAPAIQRPSAQNLDETPSWYQGSKPWTAIGEEGRATMLRMRAAFEAQPAAAAQPGSGSDDKLVADGRRLIDRIVRQYGLDPVYKEPDTFGPRMVIWLPKAAWIKLSANQEKSVEAYMSSNYGNWGVGVGRVRGRDVLYDELVVEH